MSFVFDKETPSCFSKRVSKVRRYNIIENVKLQRQIATFELERSLRHYQLHQEKQNLKKQLLKVQEIKELPVIVGIEKRKLIHSSHDGDPSESKLDCNFTSSDYEITKPRSNSASSLPSITCRCAVTGYKVRTRKLSRERSSTSHAFPREEYDEVGTYERENGTHSVVVLQQAKQERCLSMKSHHSRLSGFKTL